MKKIAFIFTASILLVSCNNPEPSEITEGKEEITAEINSTTGTETSNENLTEENSEVKTVETVSLEKTETPMTKTPSKKTGKENTSPAPKTESTPQVKEAEPQSTGVSIPKIDFSGVYQQVLTMYVSSSGKVNYKGLKSADELVGQAIYHFQNNTPQDNWSRNEELAYWINAYNLFTLKLVMDNYPVKSIKDIAGGKPWDKKFIQLDGRTLSLNDIENNIIRKNFNEPRIHFAVNCASISCPKLINKAYTKDNLNTLLTQQTKAYLSDASQNELKEKSVAISNIFDWYKVDFDKDGGVIPFLKKYSNVNIESGAKISYKEYNWNLNE